jgi:hypothetical protein
MAERVYVAASFEQKMAVRELFKRIEAAGHVVTEDWTTHREIVSIESEKERKALKRQYAVADTEGVRSATVYGLLIAERKSTGSHIEYGIAIGAGIAHICLIGVPDETQLFYDYPGVIVVPDEDAFIDYLNQL